MSSPLASILDRQGAIVLDGGLATELEAQGFALDSDLWSAALIEQRPGVIRDVHTAYLEAGADVVVTASYQASLPGFRAAGRNDTEAEVLLRTTTDLAAEARDAFWREQKHGGNRARPLVAASVGPYGAYLANGAEFTGKYDIDRAGLRAFHQRRFAILADTPADLLACETIPCLQEAEIYVELLQEMPGTFAWLSFSCRDDAHINDGTPIELCGRLAETCEQVAAVGVNCTAPRHLGGLIDRLRTSAPNKEIVVYPNSGEDFDVDRRAWTGRSDPHEAGTAAGAWHHRGARLVGGCCRTGPAHVRAIRRALLET